MLLTPIDLAVLVLGTCGITEWFRHDHRVQDKLVQLELTDTEDRWLFLRTVTQCGFCLSHWMAIITAVLWFLIPYGDYLVTIFAMVRGANLLNDVFKQFNRSPERPDFNGDKLNE